MSASPAQLALIEKWIRAEYALRTHAIEADVPNIDWLDPSNRIQLVEIQSKAIACGIPADKFQLSELMTRMARGLLRRKARGA